MQENKQLSELNRLVQKDTKRINVIGLAGSARSFFLSRFLSDFKRPCFILLPDRKEAQRLFKELQFFMSESDIGESIGSSGLKVSDFIRQRRLYEFPPYDLTPLSGLSPHRDVVIRRLQALYALLSNDNSIVVTSIELSFDNNA